MVEDDKQPLYAWLVSSYEATLPLTRMTELFEFGASLFSDFSWKEVQHHHQNLEAYECVDPDKTLSQFYAEVRKESGEDYELDLDRKSVV